MEKRNLEVKRGDSSLAIKSGFWYVVSTFLTKGIAFLTMPFFTRIMTKGDYGEFTNFANWISLLLIITSFEMYNTLNRAYYDFKEKYNDYVSSVTYVSIFVSLLFFILFWFCKDNLLKLIAIPKQFIPLMFYAILFQNTKQIYLAREKTLYRYKSVAWISVLSIGLPTLITFVLVPLVPDKLQLTARMYGFWIPCGIAGFWCLIKIFSESLKLNFKCIKYATFLAVPLFTSYFTTYLLTATNTMVAKSVLNAEAAAIMSVSSSIMNLLIAFFQAVTGALTTWMMDNLESKDYAKVRKVCVFIVCGLGLISIGIMLLGPELILILGGRQYPEAKWLIPPLSFSVCIQTVTTICTIIYTYQKKVVKISIVTAITAIVALVAKILLIPVFGLQILAWINLFAMAIVFIFSVLFLRHTEHYCCINVKSYFFVFLIVGIVCCLSNFLYTHAVIRLVLITFFVIAFFIVLVKTKSKWYPFVAKKLGKKTGDSAK